MGRRRTGGAQTGERAGARGSREGRGYPPRRCEFQACTAVRGTAKLISTSLPPLFFSRACSSRSTCSTHERIATLEILPKLLDDSTTAINDLPTTILTLFRTHEPELKTLAEVIAQTIQLEGEIGLGSTSGTQETYNQRSYIFPKTLCPMLFRLETTPEPCHPTKALWRKEEWE